MRRYKRLDSTSILRKMKRYLIWLIRVLLFCHFEKRLQDSLSLSYRVIVGEFYVLSCLLFLLIDRLREFFVSDRPSGSSAVLLLVFEMLHRLASGGEFAR
jgi:hypothetical protein